MRQAPNRVRQQDYFTKPPSALVASEQVFLYGLFLDLGQRTESR